jgi:hypothetical protein
MMFIQQAGKMEIITNIIVAALISKMTINCSEPTTKSANSPAKIKSKAEIVKADPQAEPEAKRSIDDKIAPLAIKTEKQGPKVISFRDEMFRDAPSSIYTISYQPRTDHEVRWKGNSCADLSTDFMSVDNLVKYGKLESLNKEARLELAKNHKQGVFYVEGEFTASIDPQDKLGIPHEVSVAD